MSVAHLLAQDRIVERCRSIWRLLEYNKYKIQKVAKYVQCSGICKLDGGALFLQKKAMPGLPVMLE